MPNKSCQAVKIMTSYSPTKTEIQLRQRCTGTIGTVYNMSGRVVSDIQTFVYPIQHGRESYEFIGEVI